ncbi:flavin monoamine oxidase family protein [Acidithiobacillus sp. IBUN Pt1247-S3]|uniref:flavin monoamine oxidase family protein n=1 Tax=Acidithiobacillus sp. IBUN Pt1247-S3 TaxID=3166642 RepID=UPI0034E5D4AA
MTAKEGLGTVPSSRRGSAVAIVGGGIAGMVAAYELMRLGLRPVIYEAGWIGGRLRSHRFEGVDGDIVAELGGMRFPASGRLFWHYAELLGLHRQPFPNPISEAAGRTTVELLGKLYHGHCLDDFPSSFTHIMQAWHQALNADGQMDRLQQAMREQRVADIKEIWNDLVRRWDDRTFYDFLCSAPAFAELPYEYKETFGQIGFGTGGWDSDFQNTMLEIFRVVFSEFDSHQYMVSGGAQQVPCGLWNHRVASTDPGLDRLSLKTLNGGAPHGKVRRISRHPDGDRFIVENEWGMAESYAAVLVTCQSWLLTTSIEVEEGLFSDRLWMALDRTRYMQSSKTFALVDRPFWKNPADPVNAHPLSMTLTDRLTRGTYLFEYGMERPGVICLTYSWMGDALKMLPLSIEKRTRLSLASLSKIYPHVDIASHIKSNPVTISWELEENFLGAFKGALPGHYRYNRIMYTQFDQRNFPKQERGIFLAGDDVSWTPGWAEGAIQTALNAVWGVLQHLGGESAADNPGPGDMLAEIGPLDL